MNCNYFKLTPSIYIILLINILSVFGDSYFYQKLDNKVAEILLTAERSSNRTTNISEWNDYYCINNDCYGVSGLSKACIDKFLNFTVNGEVVTDYDELVKQGAPTLQFNAYDEKYAETARGNNELKANGTDCKANTDCVTEKCVEGYCVIERDHPLKYCNYNDEFQTLQCGIPNNGYCQKDDDCFANNECHPNKHICMDYVTETDRVSHSTRKYLIIAAIVIVLLLLFCIGCCFKTKCCHTV